MKFTLTVEANSLEELSRFLGGSIKPVTVHENGALISTAPYTNGEDTDDTVINANAPDVDSTGLPWDERIHSAGKAVTGEGKWRRKRGVSDQLVSQVEAELRSSMPVVPPQSAPVAAPVAAAPAVSVPTTTTVPLPVQATVAVDQNGEPELPEALRRAAPVVPPQSAPVAAPVVPPQSAPVAAPVVPPQSAPAMTFPEFMAVVSTGMREGKISHQEISNLTTHLGIPTVGILGNNPEKLAEAIQFLRNAGKL